MIIGVAGLAGSGKSTVANLLCENHGYVNVNFADALRQMAYDIDPLVAHDPVDGEYCHLAEIVNNTGWDYAKRAYPEVRRFLQRLGTEGVRKHFGSDAWVAKWQDSVLDYRLQGHPRIVAGDVRFQNEVDAIKQRGGLVVYVERPGVARAPVSHSSEMLRPNLCDSFIRNDATLEDLAATVAVLVDHTGT